MVKETNERCIRIEANQINLSQTIAEIKEEPLLIPNTISEINERPAVIENQTISFKNLQLDMTVVRGNISRLEQDSATYRARLDQMGDQSHRDNLVFFGLGDNASETPQQSEEKVWHFFPTSLN